MRPTGRPGMSTAVKERSVSADHKNRFRNARRHLDFAVDRDWICIEHDFSANPVDDQTLARVVHSLVHTIPRLGGEQFRVA